MKRRSIFATGSALLLVGLASAQAPKAIAIRLDPGDDVLVALRKLSKDHQIKAGVIATGVGSLTDLTVRYAAKPDTYPLSGNFEVVSFSGTFSTEGEHVHLSFADKDGKISGGHLMPGKCKVDKTFELVVWKIEGWEFKRKDGPIKGMKLLDPVAKNSPSKKVHKRA